MAPLHVGYAPTLENFLKSVDGQPLETSMQGLISLLKRKQLKGQACANATAEVLRQVVSKSAWNDVDQLLSNVQKAGNRLAQAAPHELVIRNITRRVLGLIRDEACEDRNADDQGSDKGDDHHVDARSPPPSAPGSMRKSVAATRPPLLPTASSFSSKSLYKLFLGADAIANSTPGTPDTGLSTPTSFGQLTSVPALRSEVMDGVVEIMDEIGQADDQIAGFADAHIHPGDIVLVFQSSPTIERFLVKAAQRKRFTVFLAPSKPSKSASDAPFASLRKRLASLDVSTVVIASTCLAAYMPMVTKVLVSAKAVMPDGNVLAEGGAYAVTRAAQEQCKPVIALAGVYNFCPEEGFEYDSWLDVGNAAEYVNFADGAMLDVDVLNMATEFVKASLIDMYITNLGAHSKNHLASVMADHYKPEDIDFQFN